MGNPSYEAGRRLEHEVRDALEALGYHVTRAARSGGKADLVACAMRESDYDPPVIFFIQCKKDGRLGPAEWNELLEHAHRYGATAICAIRGNREKLKLMELRSFKVPGGKQPWEPWHPAGEPDGEEDV